MNSTLSDYCSDFVFIMKITNINLKNKSFFQITNINLRSHMNIVVGCRMRGFVNILMR